MLLLGRFIMALSQFELCPCTKTYAPRCKCRSVSDTCLVSCNQFVVVTKRFIWAAHLDGRGSPPAWQYLSNADH